MAKLVKQESEQEKELRESRHAGIFVILLAVVMLALAIVARGILREFDAEGYVSAVLSQTFKGDVKPIVELLEDSEEAALYEQYEDGIESFVENNITSGVEVDEETKEKFVKLCKDIFASMKYTVKEAEKINRKEYHVPVEYQTVDIFKDYEEDIMNEFNRLKEKVDKGEYAESEAENQAQMQAEVLEIAYALLETAHQEMQYAKPETTIFTVKKNADDLYEIENGEIEEFITKIMGLDEIQD